MVLPSAPANLPRPIAIILNKPLSSAPGEIGVPLHAADQKNAVRLVGVLVNERLDPFRRLPKVMHLERTDDRHAHRGFVNAVMRQNIRLPFGRRGSMASHGRKNKWLRAALLPEITTAFTIVAVLEMPRLPTPMAMRAPHGNPFGDPERANSSRICPGISAMARLGKYCSARTNRGKFTIKSYSLSPITKSPR